jgi:hypothetical protein
MSRFADSTRGRFATRRRAFRPLLHLCGVAVVGGSLAFGCRIAPVISDTRVGTSHFDDCEQAARNYCEQVVGAGESDLEGCVAKYTFQCISGTSD